MTHAHNKIAAELLYHSVCNVTQQSTGVLVLPARAYSAGRMPGEACIRSPNRLQSDLTHSLITVERKKNCDMWARSRW